MSDRTASPGDPRGAALPGRASSGSVSTGRVSTGPVFAESGATPSLAGTPERVLVIVAILALVAINIVGFFAAVLLIASSLLLFALRPGDSTRTLLRFSPLLVLPLLAAASTLWSDAPAQTLKAGLELILTAVAAILLCRNASARTLILVMFAGLLPVGLWALTAVPDALATGRPMRAFFGSKNELGMMAQLLVALALAIAFDRARAARLRWLAIGAMVLGVGLLVLSQSATAMTCAAITAVIFPVLLVFGRLPLAVRIGSVAALFVAMGAALPFVASISSEIENFRGSVLGKDATLTGRTYLWDVAAQVAAERPNLGHGYGAFWRVGNLDAEALWRWGGVPNRGGFNFHNAFVDMHVDLGMVGVALLALTCAAVLLVGIMRQVWRPSVPIAFFVTLQVVLYIRSYAETGLLAPFSFMTVLWLGGAVYAFSQAAETLRGRPDPAQPRALPLRIAPLTSRLSGIEARTIGPTDRRPQ